MLAICEQPRQPCCGRHVILWLGAHISPKLCPWIRRQFAVDAIHIRDLALREAEDPEIFDKARKAQAVVFTKDDDFVDLVDRLGTPPQVLWLRCGNMSNARLWVILTRALPDALDLLRRGEPVVEISAAKGERGGRTRRSTRPRPRGRSGPAVSRSGRARLRCAPRSGSPSDVESDIRRP